MLVREASIFALQKVRDTDKMPEITMECFNEAMKKTFPSVSKQDEATYLKLRQSLKKSRSHIVKDS